MRIIRMIYNFISFCAGKLEQEEKLVRLFDLIQNYHSWKQSIYFLGNCVTEKLSQFTQEFIRRIL